MYKNENTTYQNVWEAAITMVRGRFITRNPLSKKKTYLLLMGCKMVQPYGKAVCWVLTELKVLVSSL